MGAYRPGSGRVSLRAMREHGQRNHLVVRPATVGDADVIVRYNAAMAWETEALRLSAVRLLQGVRALLSDPARGFYLVAERRGEVVGQLMVTTEWSDWRAGAFWWIQSVYVAPEHRRQGVLRALYEAVEGRARASGECCGLRLYVERHNARAKAAYSSFGMAPTCYELYQVEFPKPGGPP